MQCAVGAIVHLDMGEGAGRKEVCSRPLQCLGVVREGKRGSEAPSRAQGRRPAAVVRPIIDVFPTACFSANATVPG